MSQLISRTGALDKSSADGVTGLAAIGLLLLRSMLALAISGAALLPPEARGQPTSPRRAVLLISIDGLRPDYVTRADLHGLKIPYLRALMREGAHASGVRGVLPTVTYPSHTTLVTGVNPVKHGIYSNKPFDPSAQNANSWYWYSQDLRVPALWDAAAGGGYVTGSVSWPVTVGAKNIHFNLPEYAGTRTGEDLKMIRALATPPGLMEDLGRHAGDYITDVNQAVPRDWVRTRYAAGMIRRKHTRFLTVHLAALDHTQHEHGPFSREALAVLEEIDKMVRVLGEDMRAEDPKAAICIVSDHGFAHVGRLFKLDSAFVKAGLITLKGRGETLMASGIAAWEAMPWGSGGSAAIVLKDPGDTTARAKVRELLNSLAAEPGNGIAAILEREAIAKMGGAAEAAFWVDMRPGFALSSSLTGDLVSAVSARGTHGYSPDHADLNAFFLIAGEGIRKGAKLGPIDMRNIAPTLARVMNVPFPAAELPPLSIMIE